MLITTYAGLVVNADHIAYVALKRCETTATDELHTAPTQTATLYKVLLFLGGGDCLVAATELSAATAQRLRQEIARQWSEGRNAFDVTDALHRLCDSGATATQPSLGWTKGEN